MTSLSLLLCPLLACSDTLDDSDEKNETVTLLTKAMRKVDEYASGRMSCTQKIVGVAEGESYEMLLEMDGVYALDGNTPLMRADCRYLINGTEALQGDMYFEGDWTYYDMDGMQYKSNTGEEINDTSDALEELLSEKSYSKASVDEKDGVTTVTLTVSKGVAKDVFEEQISAAEEMMIGTLYDEKTLNSAVVTALIEDGCLTSYQFEIDLTYVINDVEIEIEVLETISFRDLGESVTVDPIPGCYGFEELEESDAPSFGM